MHKHDDGGTGCAPAAVGGPVYRSSGRRRHRAAGWIRFPSGLDSKEYDAGSPVTRYERGANRPGWDHRLRSGRAAARPEAGKTTAFDSRDRRRSRRRESARITGGKKDSGNIQTTPAIAHALKAQGE